MKDPNASKDYPPDDHLIHHNKPDRHQHCNGYHNFDLGFPCHTLTLDKGFKIVFVELCVLEPPVQTFRAFPEADSRKQQKRKRRQQRQHRSHSAKRQSYTANSYVNYFFKFHGSSPVLAFFFQP